MPQGNTALGISLTQSTLIFHPISDSQNQVEINSRGWGRGILYLFLFLWFVLILKIPLSSFLCVCVCVFNIEKSRFENRWFYTVHTQQNARSHLYKGVCLCKLPSQCVSSHCFPPYRHAYIAAPPPPAQPWMPHS